MIAYSLQRFLYMILLLLLLSVTTFVIIQLPPGDYLTMYITRLEASGEKVDQSEIESLKRQYGLDRPMYVQFLRWFGGIFQGRFGTSLQWNRPVIEIIGDRMALTLVVNGLTDLESLLPMVRALGERHAGYGAEAGHYQTVAEALLWTLEQGLGDAFTEDTRQAWAAAYGVLSTTMIEASAARPA